MIAFVATSGGHLAQLRQLAPSLIPQGWEAIWVSTDSSQSQSMLKGENHKLLRVRPPRDLIGVVNDAKTLHALFQTAEVARVISTGAQIALSAALAARLQNINFAYIESATRVTGLSLTGRLLTHAPGLSRYVQYPWLAQGNWKCKISVFDRFQVVEKEEDDRPKRRVALVTVGANEQYPFRRLITAAHVALQQFDTTYWQVGAEALLSELPGLAVVRTDSSTLQEWAAQSDVVIAHAGTGSVLLALSSGKIPIIMARNPSAREHVDGHQHQLADYLETRGFAVQAHGTQITEASLRRAQSLAVLIERNPPYIELFD